MKLHVQSPLLAGVWSGLGLHRSFSGRYNYCELVYVATLLYQNILFPCSYSSLLAFTHFYSDPWSLRGDWSIQPFKSDHSVVVYCLYLVQLWVSVLFIVYYKYKLPRWVFRDTVIYKYNNKSLGIGWMLHPSISIMVVDFPHPWSPHPV